MSSVKKLFLLLFILVSGMRGALAQGVAPPAGGNISTSISILDYGASTGAAGTVNKAAMVAAISKACSTGQRAIYIPAGSYNIDVSGGEIVDQCAGTNNAVSIIGAGAIATQLYIATGNNNFIHMVPPAGQPNNGHATISGFRISSATSNPTAGASLALDATNTVFISDMEIEGQFTGIDCISCVGTYVANVLVSGNDTASGSALVRFRRASNASTNINTSENYFTNVNIRAGNANGYTNAVVVNNSDGLHIVNSHIGFTSGSIFLVQPGFIASGGGTSNDQIDGIHLDSVDIDGDGVSPAGIDYEHLSGFSGTDQGPLVSNGSCSGTIGNCVVLNDSSASGFSFAGFSAGGNQFSGWNIVAGSQISIIGGVHASNNLSAGTYPDMYIGGTATHVIVAGASLVEPSITNNIQIAGAADYISIGPNDYGGSIGQSVVNTSSGTHNPAPGGSVYVGAGDALPNAKAWWGIYGYNLAAALANAKSINIRRASDSAQLDINILSNGSLDVNTAISFCVATSCYVTEMYDQTGNGFNLVQATTAFQPQLVFNAIGGIPTIQFVAASTQTLATSSFSDAQAFTFVAMSNRTATSGFEHLVSSNSGNVQFGYSSGANTARIYAQGSGAVTATASDNAFHELEGEFFSGNSYIAVDGVQAIGNAGPSTIVGGIVVGGITGNYFQGQLCELGYWHNIEATAAIHTNLSGRYGTP